MDKAEPVVLFTKALGAADRAKRGLPSIVKETVTISGTRDKVDRVLALLAMIDLNGAWGHSGVFGIAWDGDGDDKVDINGVDLKRFKPMVQACGNYGGNVEYVGEARGGVVMGRVIRSNGEHKTVYPEEPTA